MYLRLRHTWRDSWGPVSANGWRCAPALNQIQSNEVKAAQHPLCLLQLGPVDWITHQYNHCLFFPFPSSLFNLIRESADAVCARLMWNQFKVSHKNLVSLLLSSTHTHTHRNTEHVVCDSRAWDPLLGIICIKQCLRLDPRHQNVCKRLCGYTTCKQLLRQRHQHSPLFRRVNGSMLLWIKAFRSW